MISVALMCTKHSPTDRVYCDIYADLIPLDEVEAWYERQFTEHGWTREDGKPFCPRHNPGDRGAILEIGHGYTPLGDSGWEARIPGGDGHNVEIEIRQRRDV